MGIQQMHSISPKFISQKEEPTSKLPMSPADIAVNTVKSFKGTLLGHTPSAHVPLLSLNNKPSTYKEALNVAQSVMQAFYTQLFKMFFSEVKSEEDSYESTMMKDIFVEHMALTMGKNITPTHEKIAQSLLTKTESISPTTNQGQDLTPENSDLHHPGFMDSSTRHSLPNSDAPFKTLTPMEAMDVYA